MFIQLVRYKIKITYYEYDCIKKTDLQKYVINNYFDDSYYENIDIVKQISKNLFYVFNKKARIQK